MHSIAGHTALFTLPAERLNQMLDAYMQGQRDSEQGWPPLAHIWDFTRTETIAYLAGYVNPRRPK